MEIPTLTELKKFLLSANKAGYAGGESKKWIKEADGSTTIPYQEGDFRMQDNYFGGEPYGGRIIVFYKNEPIWIMVYYGYVAEGIDNKNIYSILRNALKLMPANSPLRGPQKHSEGEYTYINTWTGDADRYSGEEQILKTGEIQYKANYFGGWVNIKK